MPGAKVETVAIGDIQVRVSGKGFPLILLHGFTTTSEFWREEVEEFSASYQVIRHNLPDHGISPAPKNRNYSIQLAFLISFDFRWPGKRSINLSVY
jgi:3-oxoadipate enol-lactonase